MSLLALMTLAGGKTLKSKVFLVGTTPWKPPLGTTRLEKAVGKGQDGQLATWAEQNHTMSQTVQDPGQSGGSVVTKDTVYNAGIAEAAKFSGSTAARTVNWIRRQYEVGPDNLVRSSSIPSSAQVRGAVLGTILTGGSGTQQITYSNSTAQYRITIATRSGGTDGASTTGFGLTFLGGMGEPASSEQFTNVPVSDTQTYNVTVAPGGNLTIFYFE